MRFLFLRKILVFCGQLCRCYDIPLDAFCHFFLYETVSIEASQVNMIIVVVPRNGTILNKFRLPSKWLKLAGGTNVYLPSYYLFPHCFCLRVDISFFLLFSTINFRAGCTQFFIRVPTYVYLRARCLYYYGFLQPLSKYCSIGVQSSIIVTLFMIWTRPGVRSSMHRAASSRF